MFVRQKAWPVHLVAGLVGFFLFDLQAGVPIRSCFWLMLSNAVEVGVAVLCLRNYFQGAPRLNSIKALARYSFCVVFLAPFVGAFLGALSSRTGYWAIWKIAFFSEALGFLTLMPAILGWAKEIPVWAQKPRGYHLEAIALLLAVVIFGYFAFASGMCFSHASLFSGALAAVVHTALRVYRSQHFNDRNLFCVHLGCCPRSRSFHGTRGTYQCIVSATVFVFHRCAFHGSSGACGRAQGR
jgi:integral membrane sensor domain MASE1